MSRRRARAALLALLAAAAACGPAEEGSDPGSLREGRPPSGLDTPAVPSASEPGVLFPELPLSAGVAFAAQAAPDAGATPDAGVTPPPQPPTAPLPTFEAVFSRRPASNLRDDTVEQKLVSLIDAAVSGSRIRIAIFTFTRAPPRDALIRAHGRGVDVKLVVDGDAPSTSGSEIAALQAALGSARVRVCDAPGTACIGSGIMHHKTFLFSELADGSRNVVVQASHNLTATQLSMHNNALVVRGDGPLFAAYEKTWNELFADVEIPDYYRIDDGALGTRVYFFPRPSGGDTTVSILGNVTCDATARIRVAAAFFTDARLAVAQALAQKASEGCDVAVLAGDDEIPLGAQVASALQGGGVALTRYPARAGGWGLHSKYLLIDARYAGSAGHKQLVFTGSHNYTGPSLTKNDETLLKVDNAGVFAAYLADWAHARAEALRP